MLPTQGGRFVQLIIKVFDILVCFGEGVTFVTTVQIQF